MKIKKAVKCLFVALYVFLLLIIQTTVLDGLRIFGVMPNLLLVAVICYSLITSDVKGLAFGAVCGLLLDITGGRIIGINTILCTYASFCCVWMCDKLYNNNEIIATIFAFIITFVYSIIVYFFNFIIWGESDILFVLLRKIIPEMIYNGVLAIFVYPITKFVVRGSKKRRKSNRQFC